MQVGGRGPAQRGRVEGERPPLGVGGEHRVVLVVAEPAGHQDRPAGIVEVGVGTRPDVLVRGQGLGLVGRLDVGAGAGVPDPGMVRARAVAPEQHLIRPGEQHRVHHGHLRQAGHLVPPAATGGGAVGKVDRGAGVAARVQGQPDGGEQLVLLGGGQPDPLVRADHRSQARGHVRLDVAVHQEIPAQRHRDGVRGPLPGVLDGRDVRGQQQHRGRLGLHHERLGRSDAAHVDLLPGEVPALSVGVEVVPPCGEVEVEHRPLDALPGMGQHGRGVAHEAAAVEAQRGQAVPAGLHHTVLAGPVVGPDHLATDADGDHRGDELEVPHRHRCGGRPARLDLHGAAHRRAVDPADVAVGGWDGEHR